LNGVNTKNQKKSTTYKSLYLNLIAYPATLKNI